MQPQIDAVDTAAPAHPISLNADSRLAYSVAETATLLGISRAGAYEAVRQGTLPSITIGRRVLVPKAALEQMLANPGAAK